MTDDRQRRMQRLVDLRQQALERCAAALAEARAAEEQAAAVAAAARRSAEDAVQSRRALALVGTSATDWAHSEVWLASRMRAERYSEDERVAASHAVAEARARVLDARGHLLRIETLVERLVDAERRAYERLARKAEDEVAARSAGRRPSGPGSAR